MKLLIVSDQGTVVVGHVVKRLSSEVSGGQHLVGSVNPKVCHFVHHVPLLPAGAQQLLVSKSQSRRGGAKRISETQALLTGRQMCMYVSVILSVSAIRDVHQGPDKIKFIPGTIYGRVFYVQLGKHLSETPGNGCCEDLTFDTHLICSHHVPDSCKFLALILQGPVIAGIIFLPVSP